MKNLLTFLLLLTLTCTAFGQKKLTTITLSSDKPLAECNAEELDHLFNEANKTFKEEELQQHITQLCKRLNGSVLVAQGDHIITKQAAGYLRMYGNSKGYEGWTKAQMEAAKKKPANKITTGTFFELASVSKQFTAAAVLKLIEQDKLKLTDTLRKFFPKLPYQKITIHQMLSHTSGLPEYFNFPFDYFDTTVTLTNTDMIDVLIKQKPATIFRPGANWKYTNTNYALLASIVAKVSGMKFEKFVEENILRPAGMTNSFYYTQLANNKEKSIAKGHLRNMEELPYFFMDGTLGDKGLYSTVEELFAWKKAYFIDKKIIGEQWLDKAKSQQNKLPGKAKPEELYGYGLRLEDNPHFGRLIYHGGLWRGFLHIIVYREEGDIFFVILSNCRNGAHKGESNKILHIFDGA